MDSSGDWHNRSAMIDEDVVMELSIGEVVTIKGEEFKVAEIDGRKLTLESVRKPKLSALLRQIPEAPTPSLFEQKSFLDGVRGLKKNRRR